MKTCSICGETKSEDCFFKRKDSHDGYRKNCKECCNATERECRRKNPNVYKEKNKRWRENNPEKDKEMRDRWQRENPEKFEEIKRAWRENNRDHINEKSREYKKNNPEKVKQIGRDWRRRKNRDDIDYHLAATIRNIFQRVLYNKKDGESTLGVLGYTIENFRARIEFNFKPGMSWDNHGEWEIDHRIPVTYFIRKGETRPHIINALSNLKPLWKDENFKKFNKKEGVN